MSEIEKRRRMREQQEGSAGGGAMPPAGMQVIPQDIMAQRQFQQEADKVAAEEMRTRGAMPGQGPAAATPGQAPEAEVRAVRTGADEAAYNLGAKIGAQSMIPEGMGAARRDAAQGGINKEKLIEAERLLMQYKNGKSSVDRRIINAQQWWKIRNWEQIENERGTQGATTHKSSTAWLWNCIVGKHADAMDSFPEPVILPRMEEDKPQAEMLSDIIPVVLQMNDFEETYSNSMWQKYQEGTAAYHVGWDKTKLGGIGDISVKNVSILNLFWEPGIEDIQESENLFYVQIVDVKRMEQQYPQLKDKLKSAYLKPTEYRYDDSVSMDGKCVLVDWYYHKWEGDRKILHYCQFVGEEVLYSTENSGQTEGLYEHGEYPFVLDPLYPVHGSPAGYGYIDIGKDAQSDIDTLNQAMVQNAVVTSTPRYFIQADGSINEEEFANWSKPLVHCSGGLGENSLRQVITQGIQGNALTMIQNKIDELKFITGNTDVNNGGTPQGVTAASAIAALQEVSGRTSKDSNRGSYRATNKVYSMVLELIRQMYDIPRMFRILGENGQVKFVNFSNAQLKDQVLMGGMGMPKGFRKPVFDIEVRSQRENAYTKMSQNELALQFLQLGAFNPDNTDQILLMLDMMDFRGKDEIASKIQKLGTMKDTLLKVGMIALQLAQKYDPAIAAQLAPVMQGIGIEAGGMIQTQATPQPAPAALTQSTDAVQKPSNENGIVRRSRERANNAIRPE